MTNWARHSQVALLEPVPGLVIRYSYLWRAEYGRGQEEGVKDRPCAVILVSVDDEGDRVVTVLPISRSAPADPDLAVELPAATKRRLGLDDERSWVVLTEANRFVCGAGPEPSSAGWRCKHRLRIIAVPFVRDCPAEIDRCDPRAPHPSCAARC